MYYYKIFNEEQVLGVVSSLDLRVYSLINQTFLAADETQAQYVQFKNNIYRVDWLKPERYALNLDTIQMHIISKDEYEREKEKEKIQTQISILEIDHLPPK